MSERRVPAIYGGVLDREQFTPERLAAAEKIRVEAPDDLASTEEFFAWQRDLYKPRTMADGTPMPGREVVVELRGRTLETAIYALAPLRIITPFGTLVLMREPEAESPPACVDESNADNDCGASG